jgi:hyperosmotically inducible periplasmic protein
MKTKSYQQILIAALALSVSVPFFSGCASTETRESTGEYVDDTVITTKVKAAYARDKTVGAMRVQVETFKGVVQLSGFVDTAEEKMKAEQIAAGISGVKSVANNILVKSAATP